ncbi:MAG: hypothetical protein P8Y63_15290 [Deltaproteobacteria bacterium]|jgi:deoxyinosine 3'endonuclease (endonuclease V)
MKKRMLSLALATTFVVGTAGIGIAASYIHCTVKEVKGDTVTLTCDKADKLEAGSKVKVKAEKKKMMIEGC